VSAIIKKVLDESRIRTPPASGFGWIDRRVVSNDFLGKLTKEEALLYFFLCVVADREGVSYWGDKRICRAVPGLESASLDCARRDLGRRGLVIYRAPLYQVLALPTEMGRVHGDSKPPPARSPSTLSKDPGSDPVPLSNYFARYRFPRPREDQKA